MPRQAALTGGLQLARRFLMPTINSPAQLGIPGWQKLKSTWRELFLHHQVENNPIFLVYPTYYFSVSSRRKRESYGNLIEYQEYEELSVRKKREEAAAVVETEEEIALRSYGSRLRFVVLRAFQASYWPPFFIQIWVRARSKIPWRLWTTPLPR